MYRMSLAVAVSATVGALAFAGGAVGSHATPIRCGPFKGQPWSAMTHGRSVPRPIRGNSYYAIYTADLPGCGWVENRVRQLLHLTPDQLRHFSFAARGQRLACQALNPLPLGLQLVRPRTALGYCGTDGARVRRLGVWAAAGTEIAWFTGDKPRG